MGSTWKVDLPIELRHSFLSCRKCPCFHCHKKVAHFPRLGRYEGPTASLALELLERAFLELVSRTWGR